MLLGRHGEAGGSARTVLQVSYAGRPLLRQSLAVAGTDPVSLGPAVLAGHRAVGNLLLAGPPSGPHASGTSPSSTPPSATGLGGSCAAPRPDGPTVAVMPLAGPGVLVTALANDAVTLRRSLAWTST